MTYSNNRLVDDSYSALNDYVDYREYRHMSRPPRRLRRTDSKRDPVEKAIDCVLNSLMGDDQDDDKRREKDFSYSLRYLEMKPAIKSQHPEHYAQLLYDEASLLNGSAAGLVVGVDQSGEPKAIHIPTDCSPKRAALVARHQKLTTATLFAHFKTRLFGEQSWTHHDLVKASTLEVDLRDFSARLPSLSDDELAKLYFESAPKTELAYKAKVATERLLSGDLKNLIFAPTVYLFDVEDDPVAYERAKENCEAIKAELARRAPLQSPPRPGAEQ